MNFRIGILFFCLPHFVWAADPYQPARRLVADVRQTFTIQDTEARLQRAKDLASKWFDFETFSRGCLKDYWEGLSIAEQEEYRTVFQERFLKNMLTKFQKRGPRPFSVRYHEVTQGPQELEMRLALKLEEGEEVGLTLYWTPSSKRWKLYDVTVSGVNLIANYKGEFNKTMRERGLSSLLNQMRSS